MPWKRFLRMKCYPSGRIDENVSRPRERATVSRYMYVAYLVCFSLSAGVVNKRVLTGYQLICATTRRRQPSVITVNGLRQPSITGVFNIEHTMKFAWHKNNIEFIQLFRLFITYIRRKAEALLFSFRERNVVRLLEETGIFHSVNTSGAACGSIRPRFFCVSVALFFGGRRVNRPESEAVYSFHSMSYDQQHEISLQSAVWLCLCEGRLDVVFVFQVCCCWRYSLKHLCPTLGKRQYVCIFGRGRPHWMRGAEFFLISQ
jgi:hypothetical protein